MNGVGKIEKFLKKRGYTMRYVGSNYYRYEDNFHHGFYVMDKYKLSNGWYIICKVEGKKRYYISKTSNLYEIFGTSFSQDQFIEMNVKYFPEVE